MRVLRALPLMIAATTWPQQVNAQKETDATHAVKFKAGGEEPYALSEVVIHPGRDVLNLGHVQKRQDSSGEPQKLTNNVPANKTIKPDETQIWLFPASELSNSPSSNPKGLPDFDRLEPLQSNKDEGHHELRRSNGPQVYFNVDICSQPSPSGVEPSGPPPPLELYVSSDPSNQRPGPNSQNSHQTVAEYTFGGHANYTTGEIGDTYLSVHAPKLSNFTGEWTYQISVSTEGDYTTYVDHPFLHYIDSDVDSTLLRTSLLAKGSDVNDTIRSQWKATGGPFGLFVYNASDPMVAGVNKSYCGLMKYAIAFGNIPGKTSNGSETGMKLHNYSDPYQQFYLNSLRGNTHYKAALSLTGHYSRDINTNTPGGGGTIWKSVDFRTKATDNCKIVYNLTFCDDVAYSVPTNKSISSLSDLSSFYDKFTSNDLWPNFQNSLDQIPCNTSSDARYSLARDCDDCRSAYKRWVCAVSIPRCADFLSDDDQLKIRNTQPTKGGHKWPNGTEVDSSLIDSSSSWNALARNDGYPNFMNQTGPYKEVLPCLELCHELVQSCPSSLGFACPLNNTGPQKWGYGIIGPSGRIETSADGYPVCNYPGRLGDVNEGQMSASTPHLLLLLPVLLSCLRLVA